MKKQFSIKIFALVFAAAMALSAMPFAGYAAERQNNTLEKCFDVPIGKEEGQLSKGYVELGDIVRDPNGGDGGPSSFDVMSNGDYFVVDSYEDPSPIVQYSANGEYIRTIPANLFTNHMSGISSLIINNNRLFVGTYDNVLCEYNIKTGKVTKHMIPNGVLKVSGRGIVNVGNYIAYISYDRDDNVWLFDTVHSVFKRAGSLYSQKYNKKKGVFEVKFGGNEFDISAESETADITPLGVDKDGNLIVQYIFNGISYRKYSLNGKLLGYANETYKDQNLYLCDIVRVVNGELLRAKCSNTLYQIDKVIFGEHEQGEQSEYFATKSSYLRMDTRFMPMATNYSDPEPNLTRDQVLAKARAMRYLTWEVVSSSNVTNATGITVPNKFRGKKLFEAAIGTEFTGIPFCWGGMNGIANLSTTKDYMKSFISRISAGFRAGNINTSNNYVSGSAGVDCTGFLAQSLGHTLKRNSAWYKNSYGHQLSSYLDLQPGDYLAKEGHVMLVSTPPTVNGGVVYVLESTTRSSDTETNMDINGTVIAMRPYSYYSDFVPITPWHSWHNVGSYVKCSCSGCTQTLGRRGDANNDGIVNSGDSSRVTQYCVGTVDLSRIQKFLADANGDGVVNTGDAAKILQYVANGSW